MAPMTFIGKTIVIAFIIFIAFIPFMSIVDFFGKTIVVALYNR